MEDIQDWNNLMLIVNYIESIESQRWGKFKVNIYDDCCTIQATNRSKEGTYSKSYCSGDKFKSTLESIRMFNEWYNKNK